MSEEETNKRVQWDWMPESWHDFVMPEPNTGCWLWCRCRHKGQWNYGKLTIKRRSVDAHKVAWEMANGPIPQGMWILHKCDTPPCINPDHLFLGVAADNSQDAARKKRMAWGERHPNRILRADQVLSIRRQLQSGATHRAIGEEFGVSAGTITLIALGRNWKHLRQENLQ